MEIPEVKKRKVEDELIIDGRTFKIRSFDPLLGNYIMYKLLTVVLPMGIGKMIGKKVGTEMIPEAGQGAAEMSKAEFLDLQRDILSVCDEVLGGGLTPVVRENGTYGIQNFTMKISLQLLLASVAFNFNDFFDDIQSLFPEEEQEQGSSPANTQT